MSTTREKKETFSLLGLPWYYFAIAAAIILAGGFWTFGKDGSETVLPLNLIGAFAIMAVLGTILNEIGNRTPIVNTYLGGGPIAIIFGTAALVHFNLLPKPVTTLIGNFMANWGFLDWYIAALITGSILGMNRNLLVKAFARYIPAILIGVVAALGLVGIFGAITGYGWREAILFIGIPIMGGGMGAGAVPLSKIYAGSTGGDAAKLLSMMIPAVALGNALAIISAGLLNRLGELKPQYTGNGQLMKVKDDSILKADEKPPLRLDMLGTGLLLSGAFFVVGQFLGLLVPSIHAFAWMIISVAVVKALGLLPHQYESAAYYWFQFMMINFTSVLLVGIGVKYTNLGDIIKAFTPTYLLLVGVTVLGAIVGTWYAGKLVGFYEIESSITAGLCMANMGGTGDVATLGAAHRMELMPFAQISSRIGGAIMLIIGGLLISLLM
ncbi:MAG TPA: 2-hydroxycarboxylate transporter family protein [Firmicutes bacterium]|nr:2-hydroxycarboxylate transporter family protein [Candidatus Fermentithermobacillaceae bacterium]